MSKKYVIIPGCSDLNRGDQALVWETKKFAEKCGYEGEFFLTTESNEPVEQSLKEGLNIIKPMIEHPSRKFKNKSNINYTAKLKIKWGIVSIIDFICSIMFLNSFTRVIAKLFLSKEKKKSLNVFCDADAVFIKGGGLLQAYGGITSTYSMYFWCYHIFLAHSLKKPIYMMPNSLGPFEGPLVKHIAKKAMKYCTVISAREKLSEIMVKDQLGVGISTYPDLAFALEGNSIDKESIFEK